MSVLLETSLGDLVLDLHCDVAPKATLNFLKLCKVKYFNDCCFFNLQAGFAISCGDPTIPAAGSRHSTTQQGDGRITASKGGDSIFGLMYGGQARLFPSEVSASFGHSRRGTVSMLGGGGAMPSNASAFFITLSDELTYLDGNHTVFATVAEGLDEFQARLATIITDKNNQPKQNIKIRHAVIIEGRHTTHAVSCKNIRYR